MKNKAPLIRFILISILSALLAYVGQPFVHENEKAIDLIINVFSIFIRFSDSNYDVVYRHEI